MKQSINFRNRLRWQVLEKRQAADDFHLNITIMPQNSSLLGYTRQANTSIMPTVRNCAFSE